MFRPLPFLVASLTMLPTVMAQLATSILFKHTDIHYGYGTTIRGLGDINQDGYGDYAIGQPGFYAQHHVAAMSGRTGLQLWRTDDTGEFGAVMTLVPDVDSDGFRDLLVTAPAHAANAGRVVLLSARTGAPIAQMTLGGAGDEFGAATAAAGDVNGDGRVDYIIGAPGFPNGAGWGRAVVISGADYTTVLADHQGFQAGRRLGAAVMGADDLDHDGRGDYLIAEVNTAPGQVRAYSGRFRILLYTIQNGSIGFGDALFRPGDLDGDSDEDLLVHDLNNGWGQWQAHDLRTGALLYVCTGSQARARGKDVTSIGDLDSDGGVDFAVGNPGDTWVNLEAGTVEIHSGRTGLPMPRIGAPEPDQNIHFGVGVGAADVDGDGRLDLLAGQTGYPFQGNNRGVAAWSIALRKWPLTANKHTLPISTGGRATLDLDAGASNAGSFYWFLATASGPRPGFDVLGHHFPLNPDPFFMLMLSTINSPILPTQLGVVDPNGRASCFFQLVPGLGNDLIGVTFDFAAVVFCPARFDCFNLVSNDRPVTLVQ